MNYDRNTHNFIVDPVAQSVALIDWKKARSALAVQDLAHFLLPTMTLWRALTATRLTPAQGHCFIASYLAARPQMNREQFSVQLVQMQRLVVLRAVSWCAWAVASTSCGTRPIANAEMIERSQTYLEPAVLDALFRSPVI